MAKFNCFSSLLGTKKQKKKVNRVSDGGIQGPRTRKVRLESAVKATNEDNSNKTSFNLSVPFEIQGKPTCKEKVSRKEKQVEVHEPVEIAYEGGDEHEHENSTGKRNFSDYQLQAQVEEAPVSVEATIGSQDSPYMDANGKMIREEGFEIIESGHISDPGIGKTASWGSPRLKRSCSNVETRRVLKKLAKQFPLSNSQSFENLDNLGREVVQGIPGSPASVMTSCSADRVMLKKRSSSQVLPSRSRKLWWKLFLWSHRNLHKSVSNSTRHVSVKKSSTQRDGYASDNIEIGTTHPTRNKEAAVFDRLESPGSFSGELKSNNWDKFQSTSSGYWPRNQWVAFYSESSPSARVGEWVNNLKDQFIDPQVEHGSSVEAETGKTIFYPPSPEKGQSSAVYSNINGGPGEDIIQANNAILSLNSVSTVAHIAGIGLKVIPNISPYCSLRAVDLSGNLLVYITPGSLPKGLRTLNLSRNKIATIEGLRELTRLRVLDLSYNRIARIGHGLSSCTAIKELYLAGNKISDVEGLHRLLKLTVVDLSFNKITTTKGLGQLVANYNSLLALNLLGNPIQTNIGDDQLKKAMSSLLPHLAYLNKQPIKPQRAGEAVMDSVARAALGNSSWSPRRKPAKRLGQATTSMRGRSGEGGGRTTRLKSGSGHYHSPSTRR